MEIKEHDFPGKGLRTLFEEKTDSADVQFSTGTILPGERVPQEGLSIHEENEYSVIEKGKTEGDSGGTPFQVLAPNTTLIPAGEQHWTINTGYEPCEIVVCF